MKNKDHSHHNYIPISVVLTRKSPLLRGAIVQLRFKKVYHLTFIQYLLSKIFIFKVKDIFYWLPYKDVVGISDKYSVLGSKGRTPYAKIWFEIREFHEIYKNGVDEFLYKQHTFKAFKISTTPFTDKEIFITNRKKIIKLLDNAIFNNETTS